MLKLGAGILSDCICHTAKCFLLERFIRMSSIVWCVAQLTHWSKHFESCATRAKLRPHQEGTQASLFSFLQLALSSLLKAQNHTLAGELFMQPAAWSRALVFCHACRILIKLYHHPYTGHNGRQGALVKCYTLFKMVPKRQECHRCVITAHPKDINH